VISLFDFLIINIPLIVHVWNFLFFFSFSTYLISFSHNGYALALLLVWRSTCVVGMIRLHHRWPLMGLIVNINRILHVHCVPGKRGLSKSRTCGDWNDGFNTPKINFVLTNVFLTTWNSWKILSKTLEYVVLSSAVIFAFYISTPFCIVYRNCRWISTVTKTLSCRSTS